LFCFKVFATERNDVDINVGAKALAGSASYSQGGQGGSISNSYQNQAPDYGDLRIVPSAIAPSINTGVICPMVMQGSKAGSVFFFSGSGTTSPEINAICLAWHSNDKELIHAIACADSSSYRKASEKLGRSCK
jgi:hypothetical protein